MLSSRPVSLTSLPLICSRGRDRGEETVPGGHGLSGPGEEIHQPHQHGDRSGDQQAARDQRDVETAVTKCKVGR